jgi:hypothetical protein
VKRAALLVAVAVLAGCGKSEHKPTARDQVVAYMGRVNVVEYDLRKPLVRVQRAVQAFSKATNRAATIKALGNADVTLERLRAQLAATVPPPPARKLHGLLLDLVDRERLLASELKDVLVFDPAFAAALRPLAAANATAQARLQGPHPLAEVARAVRDYRAAVRRSLTASRALDPPELERPLYDAQVARLVALDRTLGGLLDAITARDAVRIARAQHAVGVASVSSDSTRSQQAERAAIQQFNRDVRAITIVVRQIATERNRLQMLK